MKERWARWSKRGNVESWREAFENETYNKECEIKGVTKEDANFGLNFKALAGSSCSILNIYL